jgi:hypothetical protein
VKCHTTTYLSRHREEAELWLQAISIAALEGGWWLVPQFDRFAPGDEPISHCTEGCLGLGASLDGTENLASYRDLIHGLFSP